MTDPQPLDLGRCDFEAKLYGVLFYWVLEITMNGQRRSFDGKEPTLEQCAAAAQARIAETVREAVTG